MSGVGWCRPLAASIAVLALAGCRPAEAPGVPPVAPAAARIAALEAQVAAFEAGAAAWAPWYRALAAINDQDRAFDPLFLRRRSERVLYDQELIAEIEALAAGADPECPGPLATLIDVGRRLAARGIDFLAVPVPPRAALFPAAFELPVPAGGDPGFPLDGRLRRLYLRLERGGVEVLDLLPVLASAPERSVPGEGGAPYRERVYLRQDVHWSPYGAQLAAGRMAARIRRYPWFEEVARARGTALLTTATEHQRARGSIAQRLIDTERLAADWPAERYPSYRVWIEGERWSFDDRTSPILLIGDSFTGPGYGLADQLLAALGFRVDRITASGGQPSALLTALALRGDGLAGKRLVVWTFAAYGFNRPCIWRPMPLTGP